MTLLHMDGFDNYDDTGKKGYTTPDSKASTSDISSSFARSGSQSLAIGYDSRYTYKKAVSATDELVVGFALYIPSDFIISSFGYTTFFTMYNDITVNPQIGLRLTNSYHLEVRRGGNRTSIPGTLLGTSTNSLSVDTWYYIEFKCLIGNSGSFELRVDGFTEASASGVDTSESAVTTFNSVGWGGAGSAVSSIIYIDDIYVLDTNGSVNNDFLGVVTVETLSPNGNGNYSQFTGSDGNSVDNYLLVDESPPNISDFVESSNTGDKDTYTFENLSAGVTIHAVQIDTYAQAEAGGSRDLKNITRISGTDYNLGTKTFEVSDTYNLDIQEISPATSLAWTESEVNGLEFGVEVV